MSGFMRTSGLVMLPFKYYKVYAAKKRRQMQANRDEKLQFLMASMHIEIHTDLDTTFNMIRYTSGHELAMAVLHYGIVGQWMTDAVIGIFNGARNRQQFFTSRASKYEMNTHGGLKLALEVELGRLREISGLSLAIREVMKNGWK